MNVSPATMPLAAYTLAQEILIGLIETEVISKAQATALLERAITRLQRDSSPANSEASLFLEATKDAL